MNDKLAKLCKSPASASFRMASVNEGVHARHLIMNSVHDFAAVSVLGPHIKSGLGPPKS